MKVLKYEILSRGFNNIELPVGAKVLSAMQQGNNIQMWVSVDEQHQWSTESREFFLAFTGFDTVPVGAKFIGTTMSSDGKAVSHLFEVKVA